MNLFQEALGNLRRRLYPLAAYEVLFKLLSVVLLAPLSAAVIALLVAMSGSPAVSNQDIVDFLLSLPGVLTLMAIGTLWFVLIFLEQAGLILLASAPPQGQRVTLLGALLRTASCSPKLLRLGLIQFAGYLVILLPFGLAALLTYHFLLSDRDINYYLDAQPPRFWIAVGVGVALTAGYAVVALMLFVRWLFTLPLALLRGLGAYLSLRESARLSRRYFWAAFPPLALWLGAMFIVAAAGTFMLDAVNDIVLSLAGDRLRWIIPTVAVLVVCHAAAVLAWSCLMFAGTCVLVLRLYERALARNGLSLSAPLAPLPDRAMTSRERWTARAVIWLGAAALIVISLGSALALVESVDVTDRVRVTAHRGGSVKAPENTLSAFRAAIDMGADFAELDVQETADGELVVLHDADLARVAGVNKRIWQVTAKELQSFDAGGWFSDKFRGEPIPSLAEVIDLAEGKIKLNIELKYNGHDQKLARRVVDLIAAKKFEGQCVITSLKYAALRDVKKFDPRLKVGLIVAKSVGRLDHLEVDFLSVNAGQVDRMLVERVHATGKQIHVWTVNTRKKMEEMIELGVDNLITDHPEVARELLERRSTLSTTERLLLALGQRLREQ